MRTKELFFYLFILLLASCGGQQTIPERKLVKILAEMHLVDAAIAEGGRSLQRDSTAVYTAILERYGYTTEQLFGSMAAHAHSKASADKLYGKVAKHLEQLKAQYAGEVEVQRRALTPVDSIKMMTDSVTLAPPDSAPAPDSVRALPAKKEGYTLMEQRMLMKRLPQHPPMR